MTFLEFISTSAAQKRCLQRSVLLVAALIAGSPWILSQERWQRLQQELVDYVQQLPKAMGIREFRWLWVKNA